MAGKGAARDSFFSLLDFVLSALKREKEIRRLTRLRDELKKNFDYSNLLEIEKLNK